MLVWILTFVNESCRTGSEITFSELSHPFVRQEEFSRLSEVTWRKKTTTKTTRRNGFLLLFNHAKLNKRYFTIAYYMTCSIGPLLIKTGIFLHNLAKISKQRQCRWFDRVIAYLCVHENLFLVLVWMHHFLLSVWVYEIHSNTLKNTNQKNERKDQRKKGSCQTVWWWEQRLPSKSVSALLGRSSRARHGAEAAFRLQRGWTDDSHLSILLGYSQVHVQTVLSRGLTKIPILWTATAPSFHRRAGIFRCLLQSGCPEKYDVLMMLPGRSGSGPAQAYTCALRWFCSSVQKNGREVDR